MSAENFFRQALVISPTDPNIRYYLAITLVRNRKINEAKYHYKYIIAMNPGTQIANMASIGLSMLDKQSVAGQSSYSSKNRIELDIKNDYALVVET